MRVLLDVSAVPARPVGAGVYTVALASGLAGHPEVELHLLTRRADQSRWHTIAPGAGVHGAAPDRRPARLAWEQARGVALAKRLAPDVWHGPHYTMPLGIGPAGSRPLHTDVPFVVTMHDLTFFDHPEWHERSKVVFFRRMIRASARRAAALVCVSEYTADRLRALAHPRGPVTVAHHGVDHERFNTKGDKVADLAALAAHGIEPPYIAFASTIEPRKNVPALVQAFARVAAGRPDLRLVLAGADGWGARAVRDAIAASGVATQVMRPGYVDHDLLAPFFRRAAVVAYPSLEEGFGLPALEGLACGAPVVTSEGSALSRGRRRRRAHGAARRSDRARRSDQPRARRSRSRGAPARRRTASGRAVHVGTMRRTTRRRLPSGNRGRSPRMKVLITGGGGFVGNYLCAHCASEGDDVVCVDRSGPDSVDITDREAIQQSFEHHRPEVVYHLAALSHVGESWADPTGVLRVNVEGTGHVLNAARAAGVRRTIVVGSAEEYGQVDERDLPLKEDTPLRPSSPYGVSKIAASYLALQAHIAYGLDVVRVRAFTHTGPGQSDRFLMPALAHRIATAEREQQDEIRVGSLEPIRDVSDVRDVVRAYRLLAERGEAGEVYNVCSGTGAAVREIADHLLAAARRPLRLAVDPELVRPVDVPRLVGDASKLRAATGWKPGVPPRPDARRRPRVGPRRER